MTDSGSFRFPSVTPRTHKIAAVLCETGIDHSKIIDMFMITERVSLSLLGML